jgi:hypothetical protein
MRIGQELRSETEPYEEAAVVLPKMQAYRQERIGERRGAHYVIGAYQPWNFEHDFPLFFFSLSRAVRAGIILPWPPNWIR